MVSSGGDGFSSSGDPKELDYHHCSLRQAPSEILDYSKTLEKLDLSSNYVSFN